MDRVPAFILRITAEIVPQRSDYGSGTLRVYQEISIPAKEFLELCRILGEFDELAKKIRGRETGKEKL